MTCPDRSRTGEDKVGGSRRTAPRFGEQHGTIRSRPGGGVGTAITRRVKSAQVQLYRSPLSRLLSACPARSRGLGRVFVSGMAFESPSDGSADRIEPSEGWSGAARRGHCLRRPSFFRGGREGRTRAAFASRQRSEERGKFKPERNGVERLGALALRVRGEPARSRAPGPVREGRVEAARGRPWPDQARPAQAPPPSWPSSPRNASPSARCASTSSSRWQFLYFLPLPQWHRSLRPRLTVLSVRRPADGWLDLRRGASRHQLRVLD